MLRVLLADDSEASRALVGLLLKGLPCALDEARDGAEAVELYARAPCPLVLMDLEMPVRDGLSAARGIREHEAAGGLPRAVILALTAHDDAEYHAACLAAGCDGILTKPLNRLRLREAVTACIPA